MIENIELELAIDKICTPLKRIEETEEVFVEDSINRIIGEDIYATINQPPFDRSPFDGYAVRSIDTKGANKNNGVKLNVVGESFAGNFTDREVKEKEAIRIMTGSKMPKGSDCVIKQELTDYGMDTVEIYQELNKFENYSFEGEEIKKGSKLISKGEKITYIHIGIIASMGYEKVKVIRKPKVAIISTGDEIIPLGEALTEGKIYDSNRRMIHSKLKEFGCEIVYVTSIGDNSNDVANEIDRIVDSVDLVITTGGVSVGKKDIIHDVVKILNAEKVFWKIHLKSGIPVVYSVYKNKPILSLSGNPFAALSIFDLLSKPILYKLTNDPSLETITTYAVMEDDFLKISKRRRMEKAIYKDGKVYLANKDHPAGALGRMIGCNCLIDIEDRTEKIIKGDKVKVIIL